MITQFLKKTVADITEQKHWPTKMPELQTIINSTTSSSRGYSPFFMTFLKHPNFPFQELLSANPDYSDQSDLSIRFNLSNNLIKECEQTLEEAFQTAKGAFDANARPNKLSLGDLVYVETTQRGLLHHKFADRYKGPYKILAFLDNNNVQLTPLGSGRPISTHVNNCKKTIVRFAHLENQHLNKIKLNIGTMYLLRNSLTITKPLLTSQAPKTAHQTHQHLQQKIARLTTLLPNNNLKLAIAKELQGQQLTLAN